MQSLHQRGWGARKPPPGSRIDWQHPNAGAAGLKLFSPFNDAGGAPLDLASGRRSVPTGSPAWQATAGGLGRGGYTTLNYDSVPQPSGQVIGATYPWWFAFACVNSDTTGSKTPVSVDNSSTNARIQVTFNTAATGNVRLLTRNDAAGANTNTIAATSLPCNDGLPHVWAVVARSASDVRLYLDGVQAGAAGSLSGTYTLDQLELGVGKVAGSPGGAFGGQLLWFQAGSGGVPDVARLAREPFAAILSGPARLSFPTRGAPQAGAAAPSAISTLAADGTLSLRGSASPAAASTLSASGSTTLGGSASFAAAPTLSASGTLALKGSASFAAITTLVAYATVPDSNPGFGPSWFDAFADPSHAPEPPPLDAIADLPDDGGPEWWTVTIEMA